VKNEPAAYDETVPEDRRDAGDYSHISIGVTAVAEPQAQQKRFASWCHTVDPFALVDRADTCPQVRSKDASASEVINALATRKPPRADAAASSFHNRLSHATGAVESVARSGVDRGQIDPDKAEPGFEAVGPP
jgi:hypothetical protein